ncbi:MULTISPECIES: hypothetical protein [Lysobacter]|uniref:hypothetical protein n=1 Tax=Lysobacter TaxID=68 RepID=UPI001F255657|nr:MULTISPECIES: hypothetical protein [Lysobacter]UJB19174.1 hypothetical protein L1A79_23155 [Lysobacter capsici]UJQ27101.1 hypothetical protein L2D09_16730 [Lysobacter gummosus]
MRTPRICSFIGLASVAFTGSAIAGHDPQCVAEWDKSSAHTTCTTHEYFVQEEGKCKFQGRCVRLERDIDGTRFTTTGGPGDAYADYWYLQDVSKLVNCDGKLKVDTCKREDTGSAPWPERSSNYWDR